MTMNVYKFIRDNNKQTRAGSGYRWLYVFGFNFIDDIEHPLCIVNFNIIPINAAQLVNNQKYPRQSGAFVISSNPLNHDNAFYDDKEAVSKIEEIAPELCTVSSNDTVSLDPNYLVPSGLYKELGCESVIDEFKLMVQNESIEKTFNDTAPFSWVKTLLLIMIERILLFNRNLLIVNFDNLNHSQVRDAIVLMDIVNDIHQSIEDYHNESMLYSCLYASKLSTNSLRAMLRPLSVDYLSDYVSASHRRAMRSMTDTSWMTAINTEQWSSYGIYHVDDNAIKRTFIGSNQRNYFQKLFRGIELTSQDALECIKLLEYDDTDISLTGSRCPISVEIHFGKYQYRNSKFTTQIVYRILNSTNAREFFTQYMNEEMCKRLVVSCFIKHFSDDNWNSFNQFVKQHHMNVEWHVNGDDLIIFSDMNVYDMLSDESVDDVVYEGLLTYYLILRAIS